MNKLLIATTNPGKINELKTFLSDLPINLLSLSDLNITLRSPESGNTFLENALIKARFYSSLCNLPVVSDDSGFEIDALGGLPGVKSHRWINKDREDTDEELISYTLEQMKDVPLNKRGAQLRLVLAFIIPNGNEYTIEERVRGIVAKEPLKNFVPGFPFRALLYFPEIKKFYHSNFTPEEEKKYNHRYRAVLRLKPLIQKELVAKQ